MMILYQYTASLRRDYDGDYGDDDDDYDDDEEE